MNEWNAAGSWFKLGEKSFRVVDAIRHIEVLLTSTNLCFPCRPIPKVRYPVQPYPEVPCLCSVHKAREGTYGAVTSRRQARPDTFICIFRGAPSPNVPAECNTLNRISTSPLTPAPGTANLVPSCSTSRRTDFSAHLIMAVDRSHLGGARGKHAKGSPPHDGTRMQCLG